MDKETYKKVVEIFTKYSLWIDGEGECIVNDDYDNLANDLFVLFRVSRSTNQREQLECDNGCDWYSVGHQLNGHQQCRKCGKQKAF